MINLVANENKKIFKSKLIPGFLLSGALLIWLNIIMYDPKLCDWKSDSLYTFPKSLVEIYIQILMFYIPIFAGFLIVTAQNFCQKILFFLSKIHFYILV